jgi:hypothetical protein
MLIVLAALLQANQQDNQNARDSAGPKDAHIPPSNHINYLTKQP